MKSSLILSIFIPFFICAQWQPDSRLTFDSHSSYLTPSSGACCIASAGRYIHVVWYDYRDNVNGEIYYKRSTDAGVNWGPDIRQTIDPSISQFPSIAISSTDVHIVWVDTRGGQYNVYYKSSSDRGTNWGQDTSLTNNNYWALQPSVTVEDQIIHIVWADIWTSGIYYKRSTDGGKNWLPEVRLRNAFGSSDPDRPAVTSESQFVHLVWGDNRDGNFEIYYKRSSDWGANWGADTRLTYSPEYSWFPSVSVSNSLVQIVWRDKRDGYWALYNKRSTDDGISWVQDAQLTGSTAGPDAPSVMVTGQYVDLTWLDTRNGNQEIFYKRSIDGGINWDPDLRLTNHPSGSIYPFIAASDSALHIVWEENRDGNYEIYYKRNTLGYPVSNINVNSVLPKTISISPNYPNPFNPSTTIDFSIPSVETTRRVVLLKIYDILGNEITTLVKQHLTPGTYSVNWDASNFPSGIYFYRLSFGEFTETNKMILLK